MAWHGVASTAAASLSPQSQQHSAKNSDGRQPSWQQQAGKKLSSRAIGHEGSSAHEQPCRFSVSISIISWQKAALARSAFVKRWRSARERNNQQHVIIIIKQHDMCVCIKPRSVARASHQHIFEKASHIFNNNKRWQQYISSPAYHIICSPRYRQ